MCLPTPPSWPEVRILDNNKFKNKRQAELTENRTLWKSDNQGVKEETFIQMGRRGGDGQPGWKGLTARQWLEYQGGVDEVAVKVVPCLHVDKLRRTTGE